MESSEKGRFKVVITDSAEISFYEILDYLYEHYPLDKVGQIANEIRDIAQDLHYHPERGALEYQLSHRQESYCYVLYQRTPRIDVKVIYYVDNTLSIVYVTDFFPTEMDPRKIP